MAPSKKPTSTKWDHEYHTLRREDLFKNPPSDHSAYPLLQLAVNPHIEAFNALFRADRRSGPNAKSLLTHALADIGTKTYLDADANKLTIRYKDVSLQRSIVPPTNKFARTREILPAECRERHVTYRGKLSATFQYQINDGEVQEFTRDLGQVPIMIKVSNRSFAGCLPKTY